MSVTEFNEDHIFSFNNIDIQNIDMLYNDLRLVNSTIKRILLAGGYELSGDGAVIIFRYVSIANVRFEYYNEYSLIIYSPCGRLIGENLNIKNITNTTIFYFLVTTANGGLMMNHITSNFWGNNMVRFL